MEKMMNPSHSDPQRLPKWRVSTAKAIIAAAFLVPPVVAAAIRLAYHYGGDPLYGLTESQFFWLGVVSCVFIWPLLPLCFWALVMLLKDSPSEHKWWLRFAYVWLAVFALIAGLNLFAG